VTEYLGLGWYEDGEGTYELSGTGVVTAEQEHVGLMGTGTFVQTGGANTVAGALHIGRGATGTGTYELGGTGELWAQHEYIGYYGTGTMTQTGGTHTVGIDLRIGHKDGSQGTYNLSGGSLEAGTLVVGGAGRGTLNLMDAGATVTVTVTQSLVFGAEGELTAVAGSTIRMAGAGLENASHDAAALGGLANVELVFEGGAATVDTVEVAGADRGAAVDGWSANFALGRMTLGGAGGAGQIELVDTTDNQGDGPANEALYVLDLAMNPGAALQTNGLGLYYLNGGDPKRFFGGDANLDGAVDVSDLAALAGCWCTGGCWGEGDFDGNCTVDTSDVAMLAGNWGSATGRGAAPEPGVMGLVALGGMWCYRTGRKERRGKRK
jgi:hypothetical protein